VQFQRYTRYIIHRLLITPCAWTTGPGSHPAARGQVSGFLNAVNTAILYPCLLSA